MKQRMCLTTSCCKGCLVCQPYPVGLPALGGCPRAVGFLQAFGVFGPKALFGFGIRSIVTAQAHVRTEDAVYNQ